jgi:hypothetical protein
MARVLVGDYQAPWARLNRLINAQQEGVKALQDTTAAAIDMEANRRVDFNEGFLSRLSETMTPVPGAPQFEPQGTVLPAEAAPYLREMTPRWGRWEKGIYPTPGEPGMEPGRGLEPTPELAAGMDVPEFGLRRAEQIFGAGQTTPEEELLWGAGKTAMDVARRIEEPVAAAALGAVSRTGPLGGPALGPGQQVTETPMEREPVGEELVNPIKAWVGDDEEQRRVEEVLEEAGLPASITAQVITTPLNLLPIVGLSKADDVVRLARYAANTTGPARNAAVARLRPTIQAIRAGQRGGGPLPVGAAPDDPLRTGLVKIEKYFHDVSRKRPDIMAARTEEHASRAARHRRLRQRFINEGHSVPEANARADAALKGEYTTGTFKAAELTDAEVDAFWNVALAEPMEFESRRAIETMAMAMSGEYIQPHRVKVIRRLYGDALADMIEAAGTDQTRYLKEMREIYGARGRPKGEGIREGKMIEGKTYPEDIVGVSYEIDPSKAKIKPKDAKLYLSDALNALKIRQTIMTIIDFSFGLRQAAKLGFRNPREWWRGMKWGFNAAKKESDAIAMDAAQRADDRIVQMSTPEGLVDMPYGRVKTETMDILRPVPGTELARQADILTREEVALFEKFNRVFGVRQSMQAFVIGLNKMRDDVGWKMIQLAQKQGRSITPEFLRDIGNLLNRQTGRGEVGGGWFGKLLKSIGFAPGYRVSGPQMFLQLLHRGTPHSGFIRRQAAETLSAWMTGGMSLLGLAYLGGKQTGISEVVVDPFAADFGKVRIGKAHYNIWGTDQVLARSLFQFAWGQRRDSAGALQDVGMLEVLGGYLRSGADPNVGTIIDIGTEKTYLGEPAGFDLETLQREITRSTPLALQDVADIYREEGWVHAAMAFPYIMAGGTVSAYTSELEDLARAYNQEVEAGTFGENALPYTEEERALRAYNIQQVPGLAEMDEAREIDSRMENDAFKAQEEIDHDLPNMAKQFNAGDKSVGGDLMRRYQEYRAVVRNGYARLLFGEDQKPETEGEKLIQAWADVNPNDPKYYDEALQSPDWDAFYEDLEAAFAKIEDYNPRLAVALKSRLSTVDPELRKLETDLKSAIALKGEVYDIIPIQGLSTDTSGTNSSGSMLM